MLIDSHAHLDYEYEISTAALIEEAKNNGVEKIITIAAEPDSLERVEKIANQYENVFYTAGIHPHDAIHFNEEILKRLKKCSQGKKCVAIGEIGLDYYYQHSPQDIQKTVFQQQLDFALENGKAVAIHTRDAELDTSKLLAAHAQKWHKKFQAPPGVIHCFSGSATLAEKSLQSGYYISISGIVTFKNADGLREIVKNKIPLDRILVETDSPYLAPMPYRGKKNHPAYTRIVAETIAQLKGLSLAELADYTTQNTKRVFQLP